MKGFFPPQQLDRPPPLVPRCSRCGLYSRCKSPKMPVTGDGRRGVLVVAEAPGKAEDDRCTQLVGRTGQFFRDELARLKIDLDRDCWKTNAVSCWPGEGNPTPSDRRIEWCRPNLLKVMDELKPRVVLLLGGVAVQSLLGHLWGSNVGKIGRWVGWRIPSQRWNCWLCPTWHPSYLLRGGRGERENNELLKLWFRRHLKAAFGLEGSPWEEGKVPDYRRRIQTFMNEDNLILWLNGLISGSGIDLPIAFDYETTMLKPDGPGAEIVSCAVAWEASDGVSAATFPWTSNIKKTMGRLLRSGVPMIAANMKFEERWSRKAFGHGVRNWRWCTMQGAHLLDNRPKITSLTFQSFVNLGQEPYDRKIKPFLQSKDGAGVNRIREVPLEELLLYGGMDALCAFELAIKQMQEMGV